MTNDTKKQQAIDFIERCKKLGVKPEFCDTEKGKGSKDSICQGVIAGGEPAEKSTKSQAQSEISQGDYWLHYIGNGESKTILLTPALEDDLNKKFKEESEKYKIDYYDIVSWTIQKLKESVK
jgi:hypothetical protein